MRSHHRTTLRWALAFCISLSVGIAYTAHPRPLVLEEQAKLTLPDPSWSCCGKAAIEENILIVTASRPGPPEEGPGSVEQAAFAFERNAAGQWQYSTLLVSEIHNRIEHVTPISVAIDGALAAVALGRVYFFQRTPSGWIAVPSTAVASNSTDIEANSGFFVVSEGGCGYDARLIERQSDGSYANVRYFTGAMHPDGCDDEFYGREVDIVGRHSIVVGGPEVYVFTDPENDDSWNRVLVPAPVAAPEFGSTVALFGDTLLVGAPQTQGGPYIFFPPYQQNSGNLQRPDALNAGRFGDLVLQNGIALVSSFDDPERAEYVGSVAVYTSPDNRNFTYSAKLVTSESVPSTVLGSSDVDVHDRTVVASSSGAVYVYQLPNDLSQPAILTDNFEDANASDWTPIAGSSFSIVLEGGSLMYRQGSTVGAAGSSPTGMNWANQSIQADMKATSFNGSDRWFGLTVRQTDPGNYYYVTMRSSNSVQLKKLVNGAIVNLASASMPVTLGRTYNVRLEAIGTLIRAYVDGKEVLRARDTSHSSGSAGLYMYKTRAYFDNVVVTPGPQTTLFADAFDNRGILDPFWQPQTGSWALANDTSVVLAQSSIAGGARIVVGIPTDDQILQARAKPTSLTTTGERWFGLITRFVDDQNYYYVTVRNNNTVSLRRLVDGAVAVLDTAPLQVTAGTWYAMRMEAIGNSLRLYVNGRLTLEAEDSSHPRGSYGLAGFKTAVRYDDVHIRQP